MHGLIESDKRWELYRVLGEPVRLRLLALVAAEELAVGELSELIGESQPNVSRHLAALRKLGLLRERRQGTRVLVRLRDDLESDAVVHDALAAGRTLCTNEGVFERLPLLIKHRDSAAREFFGRGAGGVGADEVALPAEQPAYLAALSWLLPGRGLAIEVGTGDGRLLEVLAPLFEQVVAIDREQAQLERAAARLKQRGYSHARLVCADLTDAAVLEGLPEAGRGDVVLASRVIHHAPRPSDAVCALARLARPGGAVLVLDYAPHDDESMREEQADLWLGFAADELRAFASGAGLVRAEVHPLPKEFHPGGPDAHLTWHVLVATRPSVVPTDRQGETHG